MVRRKSRPRFRPTRSTPGSSANTLGNGAAQTSSLLPADAFDQWAAARDQAEDRVDSARYVSRDVPGYDELDGYGDWASYPTYGDVWIPRVAVGWHPMATAIGSG